MGFDYIYYFPKSNKLLCDINLDIAQLYKLPFKLYFNKVIP